MQQVIAQLDNVRRWGRLLLLARRLLQFIAAMIVVAIACGLVDYLLRLPGWLRLVLDLGIFAFAGLWLFSNLSRAAGFAPDLSVLALRAEKMFPHLTGLLASGVEFAVHPENYADPARMASMAQASMTQAEKRLGGESLHQLINPTPAVRSGMSALAAIIVLGVICLAAPDAAATAAKRWLLPLGGAEWPRRTHLTSLSNEAVQPADAPLRLAMRVEKGYEPGMRAWVYYNVHALPAPGSTENSGGPRQWQSVLMSEQAPAGAVGSADEPASRSGMFERLVDLSPDLAEILAGSGTSSATAAAGATSLPPRGAIVEFYFKAGDNVTESRTVRVVPRPAVTSVVAEIEPPAYAKGLIKPETIAMHRQTGRTASMSAMQGSAVTMKVRFNKPVDPHLLSAGSADRRGTPEVGTSALVVDPAELVAFAARAEKEKWLSPDLAGPLMPGLSRPGGKPLPLTQWKWHDDGMGCDFTFLLYTTVESPIHLRDEHGLENLSDRTYRIEARVDQPPTVALLEPAGDETVLSTATVKVEGTARDDVASESLSLEAALPAKLQITPPAVEKKLTSETLILETVNGRTERLAASHQLDLSKLGLKPGDQVILTAAARDIYELDGKRHDIVRSAPRTLRIVDTASLINQLRNELSAVRQQAIRLEARQTEIRTGEQQQAHSRQEQLTQQVSRQKDALQQLKQRAQRNKLDDPQLKDLIQRSKELINKAENESQSATQQLEQSRREQKESAAQKAAQEQAGKHQENVGQALKDLAGLLDQGRDALTLQLQLRALDQAQKTLGEDTRKMLPRTAGKNANELDPKDAKELQRLAEQQKNLGQQADELIKQMKAAAEAIDKQGKSPQDKATAQALNDAANIAQRQGLQDKMQQAQKDVQENKLSQANTQQEEASQTLQQMLQQMQGQDKKQQEMLRRMLAKLEESIARLIEQQKAQLDRLKAAKQDFALLADGEAALRRNTIAVAEEARADQKMGNVTKLVDAAARSMGDAIGFLRGNQQEPAVTSESDALKNLEDALKLVKEMKQKSEQEEQQQQRDELKGVYEKLAKAQDDLRERTRVLVDAGELNRRQRGELLALGNAEADLQNEAKQLAEKVKDTLLFQQLHKEVDESASRAVGKLRGATPDGELVLDQQNISDTLRLMAKALDDAKKEADAFDEAQRAQQQQQGEQQQGQQGKKPLVPPVAELRLLRGMQESVYRQTRAIGDGKVKLTDSQRVKQMGDLAARQLQLRMLGERLIRKMTQGTDVQE